MANATNSDKTGVSCYDGAGTFNGRTITAGTGISVADGDGVSANPTISADDVVATSYTADSGSAVPVANNLNVLGGTGIDTSGADDTLTISASADVATTYTTDSGIATAAANNINVVGTGSTSTSGSGSTITINSTGGSAGGVIQQMRTATTSYLTLGGNIDFDNSIPQSSQGSQLFTMTFTPTDADSVLVFECSVLCLVEGGSAGGTFALFEGGAAGAIYSIGCLDGELINLSFKYYKTAGTTSPTFYQIKCGASISGRDIYINGNASNRLYGGVASSNFTITEYGA